MNELLFLFIFSGCISNIQVLNSEKMVNSIWVSKVADNCVDTLKFFKNRNLLSYSCEIEYNAKGSYMIKKDTIIALVNEDSNGIAEKWRYTYILKNKTLVLIKSEQNYKGKWNLEKPQIDKNYIFKKIK